MASSISEKNRNYWQKYKLGKVPSFPALPPIELLDEIVGPVLDVGTGDGGLAEELSAKGLSVYAIDIARNIIEENSKRKTDVRYSAQDIADRTTFADNFFGLLLFKFVLTNIHRESWKSLGAEVNRVLNGGGRVWVLEPLVSNSYESRYQLASHFLSDSHCVYVFNDRDLAEKIDTPEKLEMAIKRGEISRIVKHYTIEELKNVFNDLKLVNSRQFSVVSPSGFKINTFEGIFSK